MDIYSIPLVFKKMSDNDVTDVFWSSLQTSDFSIILICALLFILLISTILLFKKNWYKTASLLCLTLISVMLVTPGFFYEQAHAEKNNQFSNLSIPNVIVSSVNMDTKEMIIDDIIIKNLSSDKVASIDSVNLYTENLELQSDSISITLSDGIETLTTSNCYDIDAFKPFKDTVNVPYSNEIKLSISAVINYDILDDILNDSSTVVMLKVNTAIPKVVVSYNVDDYESNPEPLGSKRIDFYFDGRDYNSFNTLDIYSINVDDTGDVPDRTSQAPWNEYQLDNAIHDIEIHSNFRFLRPKNTNYWFCGYAWINKAPSGLNYINTSETENMAYMFTDYADSTNISEVPDVSSFDTSKVKNMQYIFSKYGYSSHKLSTVPDVSNWDTSRCVDISFAFESYAFNSTDINQVPDVSRWNTSNVNSMESLFDMYACKSPTINVVPDVSKFDTGNCINLSKIFESFASQSKNLDKIPAVDNWNTSKAITFDGLFQSYGYHSTSLKDLVNVSDWDTRSLQRCDNIFSGYGFDSSLFIKTFDVSKWETQNLISMSGMFMNFGTKSIGLYETPNIKKWDLSKVQYMDRAFFDYGYISSNNLVDNKICPKYTLEIPSSAGQSLKSTNGMFACLINNCHNNIEKIIWDIDLSDKEISASQMFDNCFNLVGGMGTKWDSQHTKNDWARIDLGEDKPGYFSKK